MGTATLLCDKLTSYSWDPNWGTMLSVDDYGTTVTATYDVLGRAVEQYNGSSYAQILFHVASMPEHCGAQSAVTNSLRQATLVGN